MKFIIILLIILLPTCDNKKSKQKFDQLTKEEWSKLEFEYCHNLYSKERIIYVPLNSTKTEVNCVPLKDPTSSKYFYKFINFY